MNLLKKRSVQAGLAALVSACLVLILHLTGLLQPIQAADATELEQIPAGQVVGEVAKGTTVRQDFVCESDTLDSFAVRVATYTAQKIGRLSVTLTDGATGEEIQSWAVRTDGMGDGSFCTFFLDQTMEAVKGHTFSIRITSDAANGNAVTFWKSSGSFYQGALFVNQAPQEGQLILGCNIPVQVSRANYGYAFAIFFLLVWAVLWLIVEGPSFFRKKLPFYQNKIRQWNYKKGLAFLGTEAVLFCLCYGLEKLISRFGWLQPNTVGALNEYRFVFIFICCSVVAIFVFLHQQLARKPERVALLLLLAVGALYAFSLPSEIFVSWDEAIHYWRAVSLSHCLSGQANAAEFFLYQSNGLHVEDFHQILQMREGQAAIQNVYATGAQAVINPEALNSVWSICYFPFAIALWLGRLLHFPYFLTFYMSTFANMALYILLIYFSMKKLKSGKMILFVIATMTTPFFLAARYSYDTWVIGFLILGMSYFLSAMQSERKIPERDLLVMLGAFFFGSFAKTIYFPVLFCLLFLPKWKFLSQKQYISFRCMVIACTGALALSMVLSALLVPFIAAALLYVICYFGYLLLRRFNKKQLVILSVAAVLAVGAVGLFAAFKVMPGMLGTGDARGGNVNPGQQFLDILHHPIHYAGVLFDFLTKQYFSTDASSGWSANLHFMAYLGHSKMWFLPMLLLGFVTVTDKNRFDCWRGQWKVRCSVTALLFLTVCLMATALYIDFTPYGLEQINGCQPRYLIPLFFPFLSLLGSAKIQTYMKRSWYNGVVMAASSTILLINIWQMLVRFYY